MWEDKNPVPGEGYGTQHTAILLQGVTKLTEGKAPRHTSDSVASEEPLEIRIRGRSIAVTMRTPGHDAELVAGFLLTEGILAKSSDIISIAPCKATDADSAANVINVFLSPKVKVDFDQLTRHVFASSSCGVCGKASIEAVRLRFPQIACETSVATRTLLALPDRLRKAQVMFTQTGGLHAAGLFTNRGKLVVAYEDVGRHNAVDKVIGHALLNSMLPLSKHVLIVSGRTSFEIMQKALAAGVAVVAGISASSSLAVEFARESGQTLVGFLRGDSMNVYSHPERIRT